MELRNWNLDLLISGVEILDGPPLELANLVLYLGGFLNDLWRLIQASSLHDENGLVNKPSLFIVQFDELTSLVCNFVKSDKRFIQSVIPAQLFFEFVQALRAFVCFGDSKGIWFNVDVKRDVAQEIEQVGFVLRDRLNRVFESALFVRDLNDFIKYFSTTFNNLICQAGDLTRCVIEAEIFWPLRLVVDDDVFELNGWCK